MRQILSTHVRIFGLDSICLVRVVASQDETTAVAHRLEQLLDLDDTTDVEDGRGELDGAKVAGTDLDIPFAGGTRVHAVNGAELGRRHWNPVKSRSLSEAGDLWRGLERNT